MCLSFSRYPALHTHKERQRDREFIQEPQSKQFWRRWFAHREEEEGCFACRGQQSCDDQFVGSSLFPVARPAPPRPGGQSEGRRAGGRVRGCGRPSCGVDWRGRTEEARLSRLGTKKMKMRPRALVLKRTTASLEAASEGRSRQRGWEEPKGHKDKRVLPPPNVARTFCSARSRLRHFFLLSFLRQRTICIRWCVVASYYKLLPVVMR